MLRMQADILELYAAYDPGYDILQQEAQFVRGAYERGAPGRPSIPRLTGMYTRPPAMIGRGFGNSNRVYSEEIRVDTVTYVRRGGEDYVYGGYSFAPDARRYSVPLESTAADWAVHWDRGHETMITRETWHNLEQQTAVFRRGNELLFVAAAPLPEPIATAEVEASLALGRVDDMSTHVVPAVIDEHGAFRARALADSGGYLASIEVIGTEDVGRARYGAPPQPLDDGFGLSDLALVDARFEEDGLALEDALFPAATAPRGEPVAVYFEVYGASPDETLDVTLQAEKLNPSFFQRITRSLGLSSKTPFRLAWSEPMEVEDGIAKRFIVIDAGTLSGGEHELTVTVRRADGTAATVSRLVRRR
jgi:hypothetical protein